MFNDLPTIDPEYEYAIPSQDPSHYNWNMHQACMFRAPLTDECDAGSDIKGRRPNVDVPAVVPVEGDESSIYGPMPSCQAEYVNSCYDLSLSTFHAKYPGDCPWRRGSPATEATSPSASFSEDRTASDDDVINSAESGSLMVQNNRGYFQNYWYREADADGTSGSNHYYDPLGGGSLSPSSYTSRLDEKCDPGIALDKIQNYPDAYPEDRFGSSTPADAKVSCAFPLDFANPQMTIPAPCLGSGDSSVPALSDDDTMKEESMSEDDTGSISDYTPKHQPTPRSRRTFKRNAPKTKANGKQAAQTKHRSKPNRVSKRAQKTSSASDAISKPSSHKNACPRCSQAFPSKPALNKHITTVHTRPFVCAFKIYGCVSTFGSKNEWKRHVSSQHLRLGFWRCNMDRCYPQQRMDGDDEGELVYNDFNRKDLFMQHVRRMHAPPTSSSAADKAAFNCRLDELTRQSFIEIRRPPPKSVCGFCKPEAGSQTVFEGNGAWEMRMEHVGRHLESGHGDEEGWTEDRCLKQWLVDEGLIEGDDLEGWFLVGLQQDERTRRR